MRTIIAAPPGTDYYLLQQAVTECPWKPTFIVSGGDRLTLELARDLHVPSISYNLKTPEVAPLMIEDAEALLAIGDSPLIEEARKRRLRIHIFNVDQNKHQEEDWV
jgi:hypothetical protein